MDGVKGADLVKQNPRYKITHKIALLWCGSRNYKRVLTILITTPNMSVINAIAHSHTQRYTAIDISWLLTIQYYVLIIYLIWIWIAMEPTVQPLSEMQIDTDLRCQLPNTRTCSHETERNNVSFWTAYQWFRFYSGYGLHHHLFRRVGNSRVHPKKGILRPPVRVRNYVPIWTTMYVKCIICAWSFD